MMKRVLGTGVPAFLAGLATGFFLDKDNGRRRRRLAVDRSAGFVRGQAESGGRIGRRTGAGLTGLAARAAHVREASKPQPDDATLARKVETEIFRDAAVPKGKIDVNAENGVVYLRGEAETAEMIAELVERTRKVQGVRDVESLLHLPGAPAPTKQ